MNRKRVYDLPTRVFHWIFAGCFLLAFAIANIVDDDGSGFSYHMIAGMVMIFAVLWRAVWGVIGSPHARFSDFPLQPAELARYLRNALFARTRFWSGHNPASAWAALVMMLLALGLLPAEREVAFLLLKGLSLKDIARLRETTEKTARAAPAIR
jgi:cytochrome b